MQDRTSDGRSFRMLTLIDEYSRECLAIDVARRLSSEDVLERLSDLFVRRDVPHYIRSDNGPEFTAKKVTDWLERVEVKTLFIEPGTHNAIPEFLTIRDCRIQVEQPGFRIKTLIVATTLLETDEFSKDLALLYRERWNSELDLRSLKQTMQMDILLYKTPDVVGRWLACEPQTSSSSVEGRVDASTVKTASLATVPRWQRE